MSFAVALVLYVALLVLTTPRCKIGWAVPIALVCASPAAARIAVVDGTQRGAWISFWAGNALELMWQLTLAFFLAVALLLKERTARSHVRIEKTPSFLTMRRFAGFSIVLVFSIITGTWAHSFEVRDAKRIHELQSRVKAEIHNLSRKP